MDACGCARTGAIYSRERESGAAYRTRTCDPLITNEVLYQLS